jgi:hypothetical protein
MTTPKKPPALRLSMLPLSIAVTAALTMAAPAAQAQSLVELY